MKHQTTQNLQSWNNNSSEKLSSCIRRCRSLRIYSALSSTWRKIRSATTRIACTWSSRTGGSAGWKSPNTWCIAACSEIRPSQQFRKTGTARPRSATWRQTYHSSPEVATLRSAGAPLGSEYTTSRRLSSKKVVLTKRRRRSPPTTST